MDGWTEERLNERKKGGKNEKAKQIQGVEEQR